MGDPLDFKMFETTKFTINNLFITNEKNKVQIIQRNDFVPDLQRMSVVSRINNELLVFVKGSPEIIKTLCINTPPTYDYLVKKYASKGLRIIACAYKRTDILYTDRKEIEKDLEFLGLLIFENRLKPET